MTATELRHAEAAVELHPRLTVIGGDEPARVDALVSALLAGTATLEGVAADGAEGPPLVHQLPAVTSPSGGDPPPAAEMEAAVEAAEAALADARTAVESAEREYTSAQDELMGVRRNIDRGAAEAMATAETRLLEARDAAASARRALAGAREEHAAREADLGAVRDLQARRDRLQSARDEIAGRLSRLPPAVDTEKIVQALEGLRRLRTVKPRPMPRAVEIADRLQAIDEELGGMGVDAPPPWLSAPALDALRSARADLEALESGKPTVAVEPAKVQSVEEAHQRVLEAEARVMDKGSRANRRRLDEATAAEREALHALGLSSYDQFLKYLAPTLDASAREERIGEARAAVGDAETVWVELHGGAVPDGWTERHMERATLLEEAATILGRDEEPEALDEALRNHLEAVVDTTWAEDALASALASANVPLSAGGLEAAAEQVLAEAPALRDEREQAEGELGEIDRELASIAGELAELAPASLVTDGGNDDDSTADGDVSSFGELEAMVRVADASVEAAQEAVGDSKEALDRSQEAESKEGDVATKAEQAKATVEAARRDLAAAEESLSAARRAADEAAAAAATAAAAASAAVAGTRLEAVLSLVARAVAHQAAGRPLVVVGSADVLGGPSEALDLLKELSASVQVVAVDRGGSLAASASALGSDGRVTRL